MSDRCDCLVWNPAHEPKPLCRWKDCDAPAHGLMQHRTAGPRACDHLTCDEHKTEPLATKEHDFVPLHVAYPDHFTAPARAH